METSLDLFDRLFAERSENGELSHEGVLRKSGRYPWGSGETPYQRNKGFLQYVDDMAKGGMSEAEIAKAIFPDNPRASSSDIRALKAIAKSQNREADITNAINLRNKGMSNVAIGKQMGIPESSVRSLLNPSLRERNDIIMATAGELKRMLGDDGYLDIGKGTEAHLGIAESKKKVAIAALEEEGYKVFYVPVQQLGTGKNTNTMVLAPPGTTFPDVMKNQDKIRSVTGHSEDGGRSWIPTKPPQHVDTKRVGVRYAEEGGADMDGVIQLRRGVDDISLGGAQYAQVRIGVNGTHYLKGMAMYGDDKDFPPGVDMMFNTNKKRADIGDDKLAAMKPIKKNKQTGEVDEVLPFGSIVRQREYTDAKGKKHLSPINIVGTEGRISGEEGGWNEWSRTLSSQMLSKQPPALAKKQLGLSYDAKKSEFDEIMALSNPAVKKQLLKEFADGADSSAKHLKAAGLPRTRNQVILPINSLKDNEIYAPNYRDGETVVLVRHPHGGIFEIPELVVNNRNREANRVIKNAADAVGINSRVAARLSGADFDGDTVLVIPNNNKSVKTKGSLAGLKNFDPQTTYKMDRPNGLTPKGKQKQMGDISNLITDMTIKGANDNEIARAVRHSMVVIDAEKHNLNFRQSALDNNISELKTKYQGGPKAGASTLISKAKSTQYVDERKDATTLTTRNVDPATGKRIHTPTGKEYTVTKVNKRTGVETVSTVRKQSRSTKMDEAEDARSLISDRNTPIENVYADHANKMKSLANAARKEYILTKPRLYSESARKTYAEEVGTLNAKLRTAQMNAPRERQAQLLANTMIQARKQANPDMDKDDLKKEKALALNEARARVGAGKEVITFTQREWDAIQAGAITTNKLTAILQNADMDQVRQLATPRERTVMSDAKILRARQLEANGYPQSEIADMLGVPASTLNDALK
jgi:DNA-directed RNA polymerase specialized sigma24 family protein